MQKQIHIPVLAQEMIELLQPQAGNQYLDLTAGYGGHASLVLDRIGSSGSMTLVDRDVEAVKTLRRKFGRMSNVEIIHSDFLSASHRLQAEKRQYDIVFADLGVSSPHLDNAERGFSFSKDGPLDMRMNQSSSLTADEIINTYDEQALTIIMRDFGEVKNARKLAAKLVDGRPYKSTVDLAGKIAELSPRRFKKTHPATEVFQALRIAVNNELFQLEESLGLWVELLKPGGRIGVISFHSLEDRLVKKAFNRYGGNRYDAKLQTVTKKIVMGSDDEVVFNPRARSAKLRVAQRK